MIFIQTSEDVLHLVEAFAILLLAVATGWLIYYLTMTVREGFLVIREMRERITKVDTLIETIREKLEHSTSYLFLIGEGVKKLLEVAKKYSGSDKRSKSKK
jgi:hypothetical protein